MERSTNLARGLAPAYVRLAGAQSNTFEQADPDNVASNRSGLISGKELAILEYVKTTHF